MSNQDDILRNRASIGGSISPKIMEALQLNAHKNAVNDINKAISKENELNEKLNQLQEKIEEQEAYIYQLLEIINERN